MALPALLSALIGPPAAVPAPVDWTALREAHGLVFPPDYRELVETYPPLNFYEYLFVQVPGGRRVYSLLPVSPWVNDQIRDSLVMPGMKFGHFTPETGENVEAGDPDPGYVVYPEPGGLLPFGGYDGGLCLWLTDPDPLRWTVVVLNPDTGWWHYRGSTIAFLTDIVTGNVKCPRIAADYPEAIRANGVIQMTS